jgi:hypothetical protein
MARQKSKARLHADLVHQIRTDENGEITELNLTEAVRFKSVTIDGSDDIDFLQVDGPASFNSDVTFTSSVGTLDINAGVVNFGTDSDVAETFTFGYDSDDVWNVLGTLDISGRTYLRGKTVIDGAVTINSTSQFNRRIAGTAATFSGLVTAGTVTAGTVTATNLNFGSTTYTNTQAFTIENLAGTVVFTAYGFTT